MVNKNSSPHSNSWAKASWIFLAGLILGAIPVIRFLIFACTPSHFGPQELAIIEIHKGLTPNDLTKELVSKSVITNGRDFLWLGRLTRQWSHIKAGEYEVSASMSPLQIFSTFRSGMSVIHPVTVREGENFYEIAQDLAAKKLVSSASKFVELCSSPEFIKTLNHFDHMTPKTLEGYFFPDTYFLNRAMTEQEIAKEMIHHFFQYWGKEHEQRAKELGLSLHQLTTLASMIEKETGATSERPLIGSVFYNRLRKKMRLQSDPTTIYGIWSHYKGSLAKSDLHEKNEYNTYQIPGLPIGPIANPGKEALHAALYPAESHYLYFVSHNDGTHEFTQTYQEHLSAVKKFQLDPRARAGKSWRDLAKKQHPSHQY